MKVKIAKKPEKKVKEPEEVHFINELPPCPHGLCFTAYGPEGGPTKLLSDPSFWFHRPKEGWVALYSIIGQTFSECIISFNFIESERLLQIESFSTQT